MSRANESAFPSVVGDPGLTVREHFAGLCMPAVIATCANDDREEGETIEQMFAHKAVALADALLKELAK